MKNIPTASTLGGVFGFIGLEIEVTYLLSLAEELGNLPGVNVIESPRYQVTGVLRESI